jgi:nitrile hydratase
MHGRHRVPDEVVGGVTDPQPQPVYAVRFDARELWGAGDHTVTVNLWHCYLEPEGPS